MNCFRKIIGKLKQICRKNTPNNNIWRGISGIKLQDAEMEILTQNKISTEQIGIFDTVINQQGDTLRTYEFGKVIVIMHGFGLGSLQYIKVFKQLSDKFRVIGMDVFGMGASSRPMFDCKTVEETEQFFIQPIEEWRKKNEISQFIIAGHSFGGYIAAVYALKYPQYIQKLIMLSGVGVPKTDPNFSVENMMNNEPKLIKRISYRIIIALWDRKFNVIDIIRICGRFTAQMFIKLHLGVSSGKELKSSAAIVAYAQQTLLRNGSGEYGLGKLFSVGMWAKHPLEERLDQLGCKQVFIFGETDWMQQDGPSRIKMGEDKIAIRVIKDSGHHLQFDNPEGLARQIFEDLKEFDDHKSIQFA